MSRELYACLYAREFPAQALLRRRPELRNKPCVVIEGDPPLQHVYSLNTKAKMLGLKRGMTRVELDTYPSSFVLARSIQVEAATQAILRECAATFSPRIEDCSAETASILGIDIVETEKLFGPPEMLTRVLLERVRSIGISAQVIVSSNFTAAICVAKGMSSGKSMRIIAEGDEANALSSLPLNALDLTELQAATFAAWGIYSLGSLAALPERELVARMGQDGKRLRRLARGESDHLFRPIDLGVRLEEQIDLESPIELLDSLLFVVGTMLDSLIVKARARALALASVTIALLLEGGESYSRTVRPALPTTEKHFWIKLLHLDLETHPPHKTIVGVSLHAESGVPSEVQMGLFSPALPQPTHLDVTLARLRKIVGEKNVGCAVLEDSHAQDGFHLEPFRLLPGKTALNIDSQPRSCLRVLRPAEEVSITLQGARPTAFCFRNEHYAVQCSYGPWVSDSGWWTEAQSAFEQWDLVARTNDDAVLCCCMMHDLTRSHWQVVALYD